jgi:hypothetical protein
LNLAEISARRRGDFLPAARIKPSKCSWIYSCKGENVDLQWREELQPFHPILSFFGKPQKKTATGAWSFQEKLK